jgi:hypothetical protein
MSGKRSLQAERTQIERRRAKLHDNTGQNVGFTLPQVGQILGVSSERARQLEVSAVKKVRYRLRTLWATPRELHEGLFRMWGERTGCDDARAVFDSSSE